MMWTRKNIPNKIKLSVWPFKKDEPAELYWIDHPYQDNRKSWVMKVYFRSLETRHIKRCIVPWGTLLILKLGNIYINGELYREEDKARKGYKNFGVTDSIVFDNYKINCELGKYWIRQEHSKPIDVVKNVFIIKMEDEEYHIPVLEVIRSILVRNKKLTYAILEPQSLDFFFTVQNISEKPTEVVMNFTEEYPANLLTKDHVIHLLWLSANQHAKRAWNDVHRSVSLYKKQGISFLFPIEGKFTLKARYKEKEGIKRIQEIITFKGKDLDVERIELISPKLRNCRNSDQSKRTKFIKVRNDLTIDTEKDGATRKHKTVDIEMAQHEFEKSIDIDIHKQGYINVRKKEDENTKEIRTESEDTFTTADLGGIDKAEGLEFKSIKEMTEKYDGDIGEFVEVLKYLDKSYLNVTVNYSTDRLPEGIKGKKFYKLEDGITPRHYILAEVYINNKTIYLLEIERKGKSLSTLAVVHMRQNEEIQWNTVFNNLLLGLVDNNGTWDNNVISTLEESGLKIYRFRHSYIKVDTSIVADKLYQKIKNLSN